jgi:5'-deoxynucleotidase YfbR-like HD superfamily hydrolase
MILTITPPEEVQEQYKQLCQEKNDFEKKIKDIDKERESLIKPYTIDASINKLDQISKEWNSVTNMLMRELFKKK